ncbi:predicted GPI-anchored protein 58 isoform X1 [Alosa alosa]|uniref:predicted GPI-anchored protein 58 isoform X1 n=1 Tax=Alosa alosa TaxID=278164 RepID=UPI0020151E93|nr:predicted GPI-anchored protein 58 isoform X1 [Alosa alosa]
MQMPPNQASYAWMPSTPMSQQGPSQTQAKPVWGPNRPAQEAQVPRTTSQPAKTPPAPVRQVPQTTSQQAKTPPAPVRQAPQTTSQQAKTPPAPVWQAPQTTSQQAKTPPAPVRQEPAHYLKPTPSPTGDSVVEKRYLVPYSFGLYNFDNRPSGSGSVPSVNDLGQVKGGPQPSSSYTSYRYPILSYPAQSSPMQMPPNQASYAWMPSTPMSQQGPSQTQAKPVWGLNRLAQAPQTTSQQAKTPPAPVRQAPQTTSQQAKTPLAPVRQEPAHNPKPTPCPTGDSVEEKRYLVIAQPSGFQTRYVVKSFNRYVRGKNVFSQTTYIPLHYRSSETAPEPAPVAIFP